MKKSNNKGFMLIETLIVSLFVATTLIYLYVQFVNLNSAYTTSFTYNTVDGLYALDDIRDYLLDYQSIVQTEMKKKDYVDDICTILPNQNYCEGLLEAENVKTLIIAKNDLTTTVFPTSYNQTLKDFIDKITVTGNEEYRLVAEFNNLTYATLRFWGDKYEK